MKFKQIEDIRDNYDVVELIGSGAYGKVYSGKVKRAEVPCAIKVISKAKLKS